MMQWVDRLGMNGWAESDHVHVPIRKQVQIPNEWRPTFWVRLLLRDRDNFCCPYASAAGTKVLPGWNPRKKETPSLPLSECARKIDRALFIPPHKRRFLLGHDLKPMTKPNEKFHIVLATACKRWRCHAGVWWRLWRCSQVRTINPCPLLLPVSNAPLLPDGDNSSPFTAFHYRIKEIE